MLGAILNGVGVAGNLYSSYLTFRNAQNQQKAADAINVGDVQYQQNQEFGRIQNEKRNQMFAPSASIMNAREQNDANAANAFASFNNVQGNNPAQAAALALGVANNASRNNSSLLSFEEQVRQQRNNDYLRAVTVNDQEKKFAYNQDLARNLRLQDRKDRLEAAAFNNKNQAIGRLGTTAFMLGAGAATAGADANFGDQLSAAFSSYGGNYGSLGAGYGSNPYAMLQYLAANGGLNANQQPVNANPNSPDQP